MTIFVSIANYRDSETPHTVADLMDKAKFKDSIVVGVLSQVNKDTDQHCLVPRSRNVVQEVIDYKLSRGVCWARSYILTKLRRTEQFVLQIDSHTRFTQGWDETLIRMIYDCGPNAVITHYPEGYQPREPLSTVPRYLRLCVKSLNEHQIPILGTHALSIEHAPAKPAFTSLYSGNFSFTYGAAYNQVPYDPNIYFLGEETTMAVRLWTHGWDLYAPNKHVLWHQFNHQKQPENKVPRPLHWTDHNWSHLEDASRQRIHHLLRINPDIDPKTLPNIQKYGLGKVRSLNQYQEFAGIYFRSGHMDERIKTGEYPRS